MRIPTTLSYAFLLLWLPVAGNCGIITGSPDLVLGQQDINTSVANTVDGKGLDLPAGVAIDKATGRIYVSDTYNNRVLWWDNAAGLANGAPANGVLGQRDMVGCTANGGGTVDAGNFSSPAGLCVDSGGNLWVVDTGNSRVLKFGHPYANGAKAELVLGQQYLDRVQRGPAAMSLNIPRGVYVDGNGDVWVTDAYFNQILRFSRPESNGPSANLILGQAILRQPYGITGDNAGNIWVSDYYNNRVLHYDLAVSTVNAVSVYGQPDFNSISMNRGKGWSGIGADTIYAPTGIVYDGAGGLYVTDCAGARVVKYSFAASTCNAVCVLGQPNFTTLGYAAGVGSSTISGAIGLSVDASANLWIADKGGNRVLRFSANTLTSGAGSDKVIGQPLFTSNSVNSVSNKGMDAPFDIAIDTQTGRMYGVDQKNNRVLWWNNCAALANGAPADGVVGQADTMSGAINGGGDCGPATLNQPIGICVDGSGNLWVADENNQRVVRFPAPVVTGESADIVLGQFNFTSNNPGSGTKGLTCPYDVAVDSSGNVWVSDSVNNRLLKYNYPQSNWAPADMVLGQADFTTFYANRGGAVSAGGLQYPRHITIDPSGRLWVADDWNHRVLCFNAPSANGANADGVIGQPDFISGSENRGLGVYNPGADCLRDPFSVTFDRRGYLWVSDRGNNRVLGYSLAASSSAVFVVPTNIFIGNGVEEDPMGLCADAAGNIWVADCALHRVLKYNTLALTACAPSVGRNHCSERLTLLGQEFTPSSSVKLTKQGEPDITGVTQVLDAGRLGFSTSLMGKTTGTWNIVVSTGGAYPCYSVTYPLEIIASSNAVVGVVSGAAGGSFSLPLYWGTVTVNVPGAAFASDLYMSVSEAALPLGSQGAVRPGAMAFEIQNSLAAQPQKEINISIAYLNSMISQAPESRLYIARYDDTRHTWILLPSSVDTARCVVTCTTDHLSTFALVQIAAQNNLDEFKVYPNPYRPGSATDHNDTALGKGIVFSGLTERSRIRIFTVAGELVREIKSSGAVVLWDTKNNGGADVASGVYVYIVTDPDDTSHKAHGKLAIER